MLCCVTVSVEALVPTTELLRLCLDQECCCMHCVTLFCETICLIPAICVTSSFQQAKVQQSVTHFCRDQKMLRCVVREDLSFEMATDLVNDMKQVIKWLDHHFIYSGQYPP